MRYTEEIVVMGMRVRVIFDKKIDSNGDNCLNNINNELEFVYVDIVRRNDVNVLGYNVNGCYDYLNNCRVMNRRYTNLFHYLKFLYLLQQFSEKNNVEFMGASNLMTSLYTGCSISSITKYKQKMVEEGLIEYRLQCYFSKKKQFSSTNHQITVYEKIDSDGIRQYCLDHFHIDLRDVTNLDDYVELQNAKSKFYSAVLDYAASKGDNHSKKVRKKEKRAEKRKEKELKKLCKENKDFLDIKNSIDNYGLKFRYLDTGSKRFNNPICSTRNENHECSTRLEDIQKAFNSNKNIIEFDTNASIYRLSYSLGQGKLFDHNKDIYSTIYNACNFNTDIDFKDIRSQFKRLLMTIYMREYGINYTCMRYDKLHKYKHVSKNDIQFVEFYKELLQKLKCNIQELLNKVSKAMHKFFNLVKFYMSEIFIHESNLHILMLKKFQDMGIKAINVYDGFYFEDGTMTQKLYDEVYDTCTLELLSMMS